MNEKPHTDKRFVSIYERFEKLSTKEIKRVIDNIDLVCFDTFNYDENTSTFCPLAIALNLHHTIQNPTDEKVSKVISRRFSPVNILKGVEGKFYTKERRKDLLQICSLILEERELEKYEK